MSLIVLDKRLSSLYRSIFWTILVVIFYGERLPAYGRSNVPTSAATAQQLFQEGSVLARQQRHQEALVKFRQSLQATPTTPSPRVHYIRGTLFFFIGISLEKLWTFHEAKSHYIQALQHIQEPTLRRTIQQHLDRVNAILQQSGQRDPRPPQQSDRPLPAHLQPGLLTLQGIPTQTSIQLTDGAGQTHQSQGNHTFRLAPGTIRIVLLYQGQRHLHTVTLPAGAKKNLHLKAILSSAPASQPFFRRLAPLQWGGIAASSVGLLSLIAGSIVGVVFHNSQQTFDEQKKTSLHYEQRLADYNHLKQQADTANVLFVAGGVLVAAGVTLVFLGRRSTTAPSPSASSSASSLLQDPLFPAPFLFAPPHPRRPCD